MYCSSKAKAKHLVDTKGVGIIFIIFVAWKPRNL